MRNSNTLCIGIAVFASIMFLVFSFGEVMTKYPDVTREAKALLILSSIIASGGIFYAVLLLPHIISRMKHRVANE